MGSSKSSEVNVTGRECAQVENGFLEVVGSHL